LDPTKGGAQCDIASGAAVPDWTPGHVRGAAKRKRPAEAGRTIALLAQAELGDEGLIAGCVLLFQIVEQRAALVDHHQETTT